jgi:hypothetical protein
MAGALPRGIDVAAHFSDPAGVNMTADNFRTEQIDFLNSLHVSRVTAVGL